MKKTMIGLGILALISSPAFGQEPEVQDFYKSVTKTIPHTTTECNTVDVPIYGNTDKTGDILGGAIIGGIIGNNVTKDLPDGGTAGAIIGGMLGHQNSDAKGGTRRVCRVETRYNETQERVYSHSIISFIYQGKTYQVRFQK